MVNQLGDATSDYLLQHAHQPVDWWQWSAEAFAHAAETDKPVMLSVGYASCHWCHVMSNESFDDPHLAAYLNEHFVPVKVDRQQHPDVDAVHMAATQVLNNGQGGWPMTVFLTPEGAPFFAGTYFPPEARDGMPSFRQVLEILAEAWRDRRDDVLASSAQIVAHLQAETIPQQADAAPDLRAAVDAVEKDFDMIHGGFGRAPKFPMASVLDALLVKGDPRSLEMAQRSLEAMARGGIHDQVGGGFHRYAVDAGWVVPHFEKMLDDNAMLLGTYVRAWRRTADHDTGLRDLFETTAYGIANWLEREMLTADGAFAAALDADSCDIRGAVFEGIFYLWNQEVMNDVLGEEVGQWAADTFHVTAGGTFEDGLSTLQLRGRPDAERLAEVRAKLLAERGSRFRPATDRLVVAEWNGRTISALAGAAMIFNEPRWLELAIGAAEYLERVHVVDGELRRSSLEGKADPAIGGAEDHGAVAEAFAQLTAITGDGAWLELAEKLVDRALELFPADDGGFFDGAEVGLFTRPRSLTDHVTPSGTSSLVAALRIVGAMTGREELISRADEAARTNWTTVAQTPRFAGSALSDLMVSDEARRGLHRAQVTVRASDPFDELVRAAHRLAPAGSVVRWVQSDDAASAQVVRKGIAFDPVSDYTELKNPLWRRC